MLNVIRTHEYCGNNIMAIVFVLAVSLMFSSTASAQSATAYENANCNASFLGCSASAPFPVLGATLWEVGILVGGVGGLWLRSSRKKPHRTGDGTTEDGEEL